MVPRKFAEEIGCHLRTSLSCIERGVLIHLGSRNTVVVADLCLTLDQPILFEDLLYTCLKSCVGADLSRTSPIYRPSALAFTISLLFCSSSLSASRGSSKI